ncbi:MAG TPA: NAD(P)/FAD-dependent oxidoreductase [Thermoleophilaceae bacterium]|jgi:cation diffusion facilitator CzcD-associated flavoprotein CzcO
MTASRDGGSPRNPTVAIVGAGLSGLCMAIKLKEAGVEDLTIYEKAADVGGTWRENTYPGLSCDIPSSYYSYSFEPNPDWTHLYAPGHEIQDYLRRVAERYGLLRHIRFSTEVERAGFHDGRWRVETSGGETAETDFLIAACGILHHPRYPDIPGIGSFAGATFHSSRWDHDVALGGRRVGVIGTGSTGVQLVAALPDVVGRLTHFQRTPQWVFPMPNPRRRGVTRPIMRRFPGLSRLFYRLAQGWVEIGGRAMVEPGFQRWFMTTACRLHLRTVRDPELRRKLTPSYSPMCKRLVYSARFYQAVQRPNVEVVTEGIERIEPGGVLTRDGVLHELDVLVLATGFDSHAYLRPIELTGPDGTTLEQAWSEGVKAYRTVALPGFPNFFMLMGPHSPIGNQSLIMIAENQADYIVSWIRMFADGRFRAATPTAEATRRYNEQIRDAMPGTVWTTGCDSWYIGKDGVPELWPWRVERHREMLREPAPEEFELQAS